MAKTVFWGAAFRHKNRGMTTSKNTFTAKSTVGIVQGRREERDEKRRTEKAGRRSRTTKCTSVQKRMTWGEGTNNQQHGGVGG